MITCNAQIVGKRLIKSKNNKTYAKYSVECFVTGWDGHCVCQFMSSDSSYSVADECFATLNNYGEVQSLLSLTALDELRKNKEGGKE